MATRKRCPRCESADLERLKENGISPHPGYRCGECGIVLRAAGTTVLYSVLLVLAAGIAVVCTLPWVIPMDVRSLPIGLPIMAAVVAGYFVYQLSRPSPTVVEEPPDGPADDRP